MDDRTCFAMYFAGLVSIQMHPRNEGAEVNLTKLADMAMLMVALTSDRFPLSEQED